MKKTIRRTRPPKYKTKTDMPTYKISTNRHTTKQTMGTINPNIIKK